MSYKNEMNYMKKTILFLLLLFVSIDDVQATQETNFYAKIFGGANFLQDKNQATFHTGYVISGSLGYCLGCGWCLEAEYAYRRNGISHIHFFAEGSSKNGHFQTSSYMANLKWNIPLCYACWDIQPFIGAGIGYDSQQSHSSNSRVVYHEKWHHFSWQIKAGLAYPVLCNTDLTLEYIFHQGGCHFNNHSIGVGLVYNFDLLR
jgi:opacity protein-like surface antigen